MPPRREPIDFREVFDTHASYVWNTLRRLGIAQDDIEDLMHDVFLNVHRNLATYDLERPMRPWLFGFAFRIASQHRRLARHRREEHGHAPEPIDPGSGADELLVRDEDRRLVLAALEGIELDRRAVFVLSEIDEVPMPEIARALEIPVNTAYSRLRLARVDFAKCVKRLRARRGER